MRLPLYLLALAAGIAIPVQTGLNALVARATGSPLWAATVNFAVGALALVAAVALAGPPLPAARLAQMPWWLWSAGVIGAAFVTVTLALAPRLGAATLLALLVLGQMVTSLVLDHHGWLGFPLHAVSPARVAGVALLIAGVWLIERG